MHSPFIDFTLLLYYWRVFREMNIHIVHSMQTYQRIPLSIEIELVS